MKERGYSLVSQQIRKLIHDGALIVKNQSLSTKDNGMFKDGNLESRIQPGSFEPTLGEEHFDFVRSSPKSSTGRVFPKTRFLCDYNSSFDEVSGNDNQKVTQLRDMWLLIQSLPFNLIIRPDLTLNQLRFFLGDAKLSSKEIREEYEKNPILFSKNSKGKKAESLPLIGSMVNDGLQITLDLEGASTHGIVGLRARNNPVPIDLSKKGENDPERYFEAIIPSSLSSEKQVIVKRGEHYLFPSREVLSIPPHLAAELRRHSHEGIEGRSHDAGFVDPGFNGDMVFEISPDEETEVVLENGMPLSKMDLFRTSEIPDKLYGDKDAASNYQGQTGPKISKHFKPFDFAMAAKNYSKLDTLVIVQDAKILLNHRKKREGFEFIEGDLSKELIIDIQKRGFFKSRYECEDDTLVLQPIPYVLFFGPNEKVFAYVRSSDPVEYGDRRLFGKLSLGIGC